MGAANLEMVVTKGGAVSAGGLAIGLARGARTVHITDARDDEDTQRTIEELADVLGRLGADGVYSSTPVRFVGFDGS